MTKVTITLLTICLLAGCAIAGPATTQQPEVAQQTTPTTVPPAVAERITDLDKLIADAEAIVAGTAEWKAYQAKRAELAELEKQIGETDAYKRLTALRNEKVYLQKTFGK
jgi:ABC-type Fe3+-hydroxamate transport system substrate-binding protein